MTEDHISPRLDNNREADMYGLLGIVAAMVVWTVADWLGSINFASTSTILSIVSLAILAGTAIFGLAGQRRDHFR